MIDLADVPETRDLPPARRTADQAMLMGVVEAEHGRAPRRHLRVTTVATVGVVVVLTVGGVAAAGVLLAPKQATDRVVGRCYSTISSNFGEDFPGTSVQNAARPGQEAPELPPLVIGACAAGWRIGTISAPNSTPSPNASGEYPVPPLVACVLPSGEAAVFPGPPNTCTGLGLSPLKE